MQDVLTWGSDGYARVSTDDQHFDLRIAALSERAFSPPSQKAISVIYLAQSARNLLDRLAQSPDGLDLRWDNGKESGTL
jgi:hypothetical protein